MKNHAVKKEYRVKGKGKAVPFHARSGADGSRKLRFPDYKGTGWW